MSAGALSGANATPDTLEVGSPARSVVHAYQQLLDDWNTGSHTVPDINDALEHHRLLDAIERSAREQDRIRL